jgi:hypothetical protein
MAALQARAATWEELHCPHNVARTHEERFCGDGSLVLRCYFSECHFVEGCEMLRKPVQSTSVGAAGGYAPGLQTEYPNLADFLCQTSWEDAAGKRESRTPGSLTVFVEMGKVKLCLNDKALMRVGFLSADSMEEALINAERKLGDDSVDWRPSDEARKKK